MSERAPSFEDLISPLDGREFFCEYWERRFLYLASPGRAGRFDKLFSIRDVDRWLATVRSGDSDSVLLAPPEGTNGGQQRYRPQDVAIDSIYESFAKGYSVVLNHLEDSWPPVRPLVKEVGRVFCADVGVNVYLTPKGSRTFPVHVDDHDVFILQVEGEKTWNVHELKVLPVNQSHLTFGKDVAFSAEWGVDRVQTPLLAELRLTAGEVLYVPRGMPHCAVARDATSLHLTISITPLYWMDFLKAAVEQVHVHAGELRKALPPGFVSDPDAREQMRRDFSAALRAFQAHVSFEETLEAVMRNRVRAQAFPPDGHFAQLDQLRELTLTSAVRHRDSILCAVESHPSFSNIRFGSRHVRGPARLLRALEFIRDQEQFAVAELPGLDDQSKIVLVRRLIREGLLRFATSPHREAETGPAPRGA